MTNIHFESKVFLQNILPVYQKINFDNLQIDTNEERSITLPTIREKVLIVHGHNAKHLYETSDCVRKLRLEPVILQHQTNGGKTILEKLEQCSNDIAAAIVLITADDIGNVKTSTTVNQRARQNVILELGFLMGKINRDKVIPIIEKPIELPGDMSGMVYVELNSNEWKIKMAQELKNAGCHIDLNLLF